MNGSAYWDSQYKYYMNNEPPKIESYYNKSFADKINEAQQNIDNLVLEKDKSWSATGQAQDEYNAFNGSISKYNDVYMKAESEFGVTEHQEQYEKSKKALALAESTLDALPSSINASSNRVLSQSQREARYNALSDKYLGYRDNLMARSSAYEEVWKKARENQSDYAKAEIAGQYSKLNDYNNAWVSAMNEYSQAQQRLTQAKLEKMEWERGYRDWQHQQYQNEWIVWFNNMSSALDRYIEALNTELTLKQTEAYKRRTDTNARLANLKNSMADTLVDYHWYQQAGK